MADFVNLKVETLMVLDRLDYTIDDIAWVGSDELEIPVDRFFELADQEYDSDFGSAKVCRDLIICMKDGSWFERDEYDGSEWWQYRTAVRRPSMFLAEVETVFVKDYNRVFLAECNLKED
jgi:hypothetical protein